MEKRRLSLLVVLVFLFLSGIVISGCGSMQSADVYVPDNLNLVDPIFLDFYKLYGGAEIFGYPISSAYTTEQGKRNQYFESVLMSYDNISQEISFEPLGIQLGLASQPVSAWDGPTDNGLVVGSFFVPSFFSSTYLAIGPDLIGQPLTDPFVNISKNRVEQHFETMGFYYNLDDPEQKVKLLHYGRLHCAGCSAQAFDNMAIVAPPLTETFFINQINLSGFDLSLTGEVIEGPLQRKDGTADLIFDFMVLYEQDGVMKIRDLPVLLGLDDEFLYAPNNRNGLVFREIRDGAGHNVLYLFDDFIKANGGYAVSGDPITELILLNAETKELRQCFKNYCLDFNPNAFSSQVRPTPLGAYYLEKFAAEFPTPKSSTTPDTKGNQTITTANNSTTHRSEAPFVLLAWEDHTVVDSETPQTIFIMVTLQQTPQPGMDLTLSVEYPDGQETTVTLPTTNQEGLTGYTLPPIAGDNGDLVRYEACLFYQDLPPICVEQIFMIWGNP